MDPFRNPELPVAERVTDLLSRLTLAEKVGQLNQRLLGWQTWQRRGDGFALNDSIDAEVARTGGIGAVYGVLRADAWSGMHWGNGARPEDSAELTAMIQERVVSVSRLKIPALFAEEAPHGHQALGGQVLPTNIGVAASWRPELLEEAAAHVGAELRARGTHLALVSGLDLLRDPRWGRAEECFGEDPLLAGVFTRSLVRGLQANPGVGAVLKHFAAQGAGIGGRNGSGAPIGPRELTELHLPAARAGVEEGAVGVMAAYNDIDGIPCIANTDLLTRILRHDWGFGGLVMADMGAIDRLRTAAVSWPQAAALALRAGVDLSLHDVAFTKIIDTEAGGPADPIMVDLIDRACARVLKVKIDLGLLDPPQPVPNFPPPASLDQLTADSAVLISNDGTLPLRNTSDAPLRVAVIGPNADDLDALLGDYVAPQSPGAGVTIADGLRRRLGSDRIVVEPGSGWTTPIDDGITRAVAAARTADLVVLAIGSTGQRSYQGAFADNGAGLPSDSQISATTGEGFDVADVELPRAQRDLVAAVAATGRPVVAVVVSGRPLGLDCVVEQCSAVLLVWYPGPDGGRAVAELLTGDREPAGRLPVSLPRSSGGLPVAYNERLESVSRYIDLEAGAPYGFGFGLGYGDWQLDNVRSTDGDRMGLAATLSNRSDRAGRRVIQLYGRAVVPAVQPRRAVLLGFTEVVLDARQQTDVVVEIRPDARACWGELPPETVVELWLSSTGAADRTRLVQVRGAELSSR